MVLISIIVLSQNILAFENPYDLRTIVGTDDRQAVSITLNAPFTGILRVTAIHACGECNSTVSTGFLISNNCFLTAAHSLKCSEHFQGVSAIRVRALKTSSGTYNIDKTYAIDNLTVYVPSEYDIPGRANWDFAFVILPEAIGTSSTKFKLEVSQDTSLQNKQIYVAGFDNGIMYIDDDAICGYTGYRVYYYADAANGQSGSPVFYRNSSGEFVVIAIHTHGFDTAYPANEQYNRGRRITQDLINRLSSYGIDV